MAGSSPAMRVNMKSGNAQSSWPPSEAAIQYAANSGRAPTMRNARPQP